MNKSKFDAYENIRKAGKTNMFDVVKVVSLSKGLLSVEDCLEIMRNYDNLGSKLFASKGGKASAKSLTKEQRVARATKAVRAREAKKLK